MVPGTQYSHALLRKERLRPWDNGFLQPNLWCRVLDIRSISLEDSALYYIRPEALEQRFSLRASIIWVSVYKIVRPHKRMF